MNSILLLLCAALTGGTTGLGDDNFAVREAAYARLSKWGFVAWPVVNAGEACPDIETAFRCRRLEGDLLRKTGFDFRRIATLRVAWGLLHDGDGNHTFLTEEQSDAVYDGGPALWTAIDDVVDAIYDHKAPGFSAWDHGRPTKSFDPADMVGFITVIRHFLRGIPEPHATGADCTPIPLFIKGTLPW